MVMLMAEGCIVAVDIDDLGGGGVLTTTSLLRRDKVVVADRVWLTMEELEFLLFGERKTDMAGGIRLPKD